MTEKDTPARRDYEEVVVEVRDGKADVTKLPASAVAFVCDHDEAEELESMGEAYALRTVRGPVDRSTLGPGLLREKLMERLREIDSVREAMSALLDGLPMEDAERLGVAFGSLTDAQGEIVEAMDEALAEERAPSSPTPAPLPDRPAPGQALDSRPGLMTAGRFRNVAERLANSCHVRYWLGYNARPDGLAPPEGEPALMALEALDVTEDGPGSPPRAAPARLDERELRKMGFARERRGGCVYWVVERTGEGGTPWSDRHERRPSP